MMEKCSDQLDRLACRPDEVEAHRCEVRLGWLSVIRAYHQAWVWCPSMSSWQRARPGPPTHEELKDSLK